MSFLSSSNLDEHMLCIVQVSLVNLALRNEGLIVPGYTHLQRAQPVLLPHLLLAYVEQVSLFRHGKLYDELPISN